MRPLGLAAWQAIRVLAVDPAGVGGLILRGCAGPERDALLRELQALVPAGTPWRRLPVNVDEQRLSGGVDLGLSLAAGRPVRTAGLLAETAGGVLVVPMAERLEIGVAARLALAMEPGGGVSARAESPTLMNELSGGSNGDGGGCSDGSRSDKRDGNAGGNGTHSCNGNESSNGNECSSGNECSNGDGDGNSGDRESLTDGCVEGGERNGNGDCSTSRGLAIVALDEGQSDDEGLPSSLHERLGLMVTLSGETEMDELRSEQTPQPAPPLTARPAPTAPALQGSRASMGAGDSTPTTDIAEARERLRHIPFDNDAVAALCATAAALGLDSMRTVWQAWAVARAAAALAGRDQVAQEDAEWAARLVLAPRARVVPSTSDGEQASGDQAAPNADPADSADDADRDGSSQDGRCEADGNADANPNGNRNGNGTSAPDSPPLQQEAQCPTDRASDQDADGPSHQRRCRTPSQNPRGCQSRNPAGLVAKPLRRGRRPLLHPCQWPQHQPRRRTHAPPHQRSTADLPARPADRRTPSGPARHAARRRAVATPAHSGA